jgi:hypothetical protein
MADILRHSDAGRALAIYDHTLRDMDEVRGKFLQKRAVYLSRSPLASLPSYDISLSYHNVRRPARSCRVLPHR